MNTKRFFCLFFLIVIPLFSSNSLADSRSKKVLDSRNSGTWQFVPLPRKWMRKHWKGGKPKSVYLALRGPHPHDLAEYSPCSDPLRLLVGVSSRDKPTFEYLIHCVNFCALEEEKVSGKKALWGRSNYLSGMSAQQLNNGNIEVFLHFQKLLPTSKKTQNDLMTVNKVVLSDEKRVRKHVFSPKQIINATKYKLSNACINYEEELNSQRK